MLKVTPEQQKEIDAILAGDKERANRKRLGVIFGIAAAAITVFMVASFPQPVPVASRIVVEPPAAVKFTPSVTRPSVPTKPAQAEYNSDQLQAITLLNSLPSPRCQRGGWTGSNPVTVWWTCDSKLFKITMSNGRVTNIEGD